VKKQKKRWEETSERIRKSKQMYVERARQLGESLGATLVSITGFPPGVQSDPAVYRSKHDESYFMGAGKKGEVATYNDPEEIRKRAKRLYRVPLDLFRLKMENMQLYDLTLSVALKKAAYSTPQKDT
jgi:hypothetical protein